MSADLVDWGDVGPYLPFNPKRSIWNSYGEHPITVIPRTHKEGEFMHRGRRRATPNKKNRIRLRLRVFTRDNFTCQEKTCNKVFEAPANFDGSQPIEGLTLGHVIPRGWGGPWTIANLRAECYDCNNKRGDTLWED